MLTYANIPTGKINVTPLITHRYKLADIAEAYHLFENKLDGVIKVAVEPKGCKLQRIYQNSEAYILEDNLMVCERREKVSAFSLFCLGI